MAEIDNLSIVISGEDQKAKSSIDALASTLEKLRNSVTGNIKGLTQIAKGITAISTAANSIYTGAPGRLKALADSLHSLRGLENVKISTSIGSRLISISTAIRNIEWTDGDKIEALAKGLRPLSELGKSNLTTFINQLGKLPDVISKLDNADMGKFAAQMKEAADAIQPLANEMNKVSAGFSAFPIRIQRIIQSNAALATSNQKTAKSYGVLGTGISSSTLKFGALIAITRRIASIFSEWITESNAYVENLNLFTVAMGDYAQSAQEYAEQVGEIMGIDPSTWMRNQGVFMTLATGFGVTAERAALMSKNLTQLGYDLSSFFNIGVEDAMQKLQSGISGELEPLRRLGFDLSQARLQATALSLGIDQSISSMNQAEKAQLRYYAILTQVTQAQGDMARTLESPANQLRILQAQLTQAARALGNIFIPALNAILPYAIAFVQVIRWVAEEIANLFGFSLPEVDYSGITNITDSANDAEDALGGAGSAAKKLKGQLAGFDEITLITQTSGGGGGGGASGVSGSDWDFDLPEYDFLGDALKNKANEIAEAILPVLKKVLEMAAEIYAVILAWKVTNSTLKGLKQVVDYFKKGKKELDGWEKTERILQGIMLIAIGAKWSYDAGFEIGKGTAAFTDYIKAVLGPVATAVGGALIGSAVPGLGTAAGFAIGLTIGVLMELAGIMEGAAAAKTIDTFIEKTSEGNVSVTEFANAATRAFEEISAVSSIVANYGTQIESQNEKIESAKIEIEKYLGSWRVLGSVTKDEIGGIIDQLSLIQSVSEEKLSLAANALKTTIVGAMKNASEETQAMHDKYLELVLLIEADGNQALADMKTELRDLEQQYESLNEEMPNYATESQKIMNEIVALTKEMYNLDGGTSDVTSELEHLNQSITSMDFSDFQENPEKVKIALEELGDASNAAAQNATDAYNTNIQSIDELLRYTSEQSPKWQSIVQSAMDLGIELSDTPTRQELKAGLEEYYRGLYEEEMQQITALTENSHAVIAEQLAQQVSAIAFEEVSLDKDKWSEMLFNGLQYAEIGPEGQQQVNDAIFNAQRNAIETTLARLKSDESIGSVFEALEDSLFDTSTVIDLANSAGVDLGKRATEGVGSGMTDPVAQGFVNSGFETLASLMVSAGKSAFDIHSPAGITEPLGEGLTAGVAAGMTNNIASKYLKTEAKKLADLVTTTTESVFKENDFVEFGRTITTDIADGISRAGTEPRDAIEKIGEELHNSLEQKIIFGSPFQQLGQTIPNDLATAIASNKHVATSAIETMMEELNNASKEGIGKMSLETNQNMEGLLDEMNNAISNLDLASGFERAFKDAISTLERSMDSAKRTVRKSLSNIFVGVDIKMPHFSVSGNFSMDPPRVPNFKVKWYASGGFPETGELFLAREAGPELVGSMNGRTTVANNEQIVDGISVGVANANRESNELLRKQNELLMALLEKELTLGEPNANFGRFVDRSLAKYETIRGY